MKTQKITLVIATSLLCGCCCFTENKEEFTLVWEENFDELDPEVWGRVSRGTAAWKDTQAPDEERCFELKDGKMILRGIVNDDLTRDTSAYLTGGICTKGKKSFFGGRLEVCAKLGPATGAWPAIWLLPFEEDKYGWPDGGEIDIMERLNYDDYAYQTVHSAYTWSRRDRDNGNSRTGSIKPDEFNVYGVDMYKDSVVFHINGVRTFAYLRDEKAGPEQFPFYKPMYLIIDQQLGGPWVGGVDPTDLPVEMVVDWVRFYANQSLGYNSPLELSDPKK